MSRDGFPAVPLSGLRIFLAEDEFHVLLLIEEMLRSLGCELVETASTLDGACRCVELCDVDAAILDINLMGQRIYPAAKVLRRRNVPIVFSTGYGLAGVEPEWAHYPVVQKPFPVDELGRALKQATARVPTDGGIDTLKRPT